MAMTERELDLRIMVSKANLDHIEWLLANKRSGNQRATVSPLDNLIGEFRRAIALAEMEKQRLGEKA